MDPRFLCADLRDALTAIVSSGAKLPCLTSVKDVEDFHLYSARHGAIMQLFIDGRHTVERIAELARAKPSTLMRYYRRHDLLDDTLESNGRCTAVSLRTVVARAREDGILASEAATQEMLRQCSPPLTLESALALPRGALFDALVPMLLRDATRYTAPMAALLRSSWVCAGMRRSVDDVDDGGAMAGLGMLTEDDVAPRNVLLDGLRRAAREAYEATCDAIADLEDGVHDALLGIEGVGEADEAMQIAQQGEAMVVDANGATVVTVQTEGPAQVVVDASVLASDAAPAARATVLVDAHVAASDAASAPRAIVVGAPHSACARHHRRGRMQVYAAVEALNSEDSADESEEEVERGAAGPGCSALFLRSDLDGVALPPLTLLGDDGPTGVAARLTRLRRETGRRGQAVAVWLGHVVRWDMYLQALSCGHAGLLAERQRDVLRRRPDLVVHAFTDMVREVGAGASARLAFPRGGVAALLLPRLTRADLRALVAALSLRSLASNTRARRIALAELDDEDPRIVAGQGALHGAFASLVRELHAPGALFHSALSTEVIESGLTQLTMPARLVRRLGHYYGLSKGSTRLAASEDLEEVIGERCGGASRYQFDACKQVRPYSTGTVRTLKASLARYLQALGWPTQRIAATATRRAYTVVDFLQQRAPRRAFFVACRLSAEAGEYRAMAATQSVMHFLLLLFNLSKALDLLLWVAMALSSALGLRLSCLCSLKVKDLRFGASATRADIAVTLAASKGDGGGEGFTRMLQHCSGCQHEHKTHEDASGLAFSVQRATGMCAGGWCPACLLLHFLDSRGGLAHLVSVDAWLICEAAGGFSFESDDADDEVGAAVPAAPQHFGADALSYASYNPLLRRLLVRANKRRLELGLDVWSRAEFHWHMFRHGAAIMALVMGDAPSEIERRLRMKPETLVYYRQHVTPEYDAAVGDASSTRPFVVDVSSLVEPVRRQLPSAWTAQAVRGELEAFLQSIGLTVPALRGQGAGFRQAAVNKASAERRLHRDLVMPLLVALDGTASVTMSTGIALQDLGHDLPRLRESDAAPQEGGAEAVARAATFGLERDGGETITVVGGAGGGAADDASVTDVGRAEVLQMWEELRAGLV